MAPQLAPDCTVPTLAGQPVRITSHALDRFQERMSPDASRQMALGAMRELLAYALVRTTPRWWTSGRAEPGTRFVYSDLDPDVCLVVNGDAVVTVLTRDLCLPAPLKLVRRPTRSRPRPRVYSRRWDVESLLATYEPLPADLADLADLAEVA
ncbi:MAG TPA: hypothetical protein VGR61_07620 [Candidatus Dormibacteraeota bacterium]|nr:hypothetical protein [Candidatus Dormibacteraeota bacterium]